MPPLKGVSKRDAPLKGLSSPDFDFSLPPQEGSA
jgi:hypothetical protein